MNTLRELNSTKRLKGHVPKTAGYEPCMFYLHWTRNDDTGDQEIRVVLVTGDDTEEQVFYQEMVVARYSFDEDDTPEIDDDIIQTYKDLLEAYTSVKVGPREYYFRERPTGGMVITDHPSGKWVIVDVNGVFYAHNDKQLVIRVLKSLEK